MSKSLGNFLTVRQLLDSGIRGEVIRYVFLNTHYRKPLDWNDNIVFSAQESLNRMYTALNVINENLLLDDVEISNKVIDCLKDDMNTPKAVAVLHEMVTKINKEPNIDEKIYLIKVLIKSANFLGILYYSWQEWFKINDDQEITQLIHERKEAKANGDFKKS